MLWPGEWCSALTRRHRRQPLHLDPLPPDPLDLLVRDQQLAAPPTDRRHLALPDRLCQLDRADAEPETASARLSGAAGT